MKGTPAKPSSLHLHNMDFVNIEHFPWGLIQRIDLASEEKLSGFKVALNMLYPMKWHDTHRHSGYEEFILGISGESTHEINGHYHTITSGSMVYIPGESTHKMYNYKDEAASFISITNPVGRMDIVGDNRNSAGQSLSGVYLRDIINEADIDSLLEKFSDAMNIGAMLISSSGEVLTAPKNIPEFCHICLRNRYAECLTKHLGGQPHFKCKFGIYSHHKDIMLGEVLLGRLGCGYRQIGDNMDVEEIIKRELYRDEDKEARRALLKMDSISSNQLAGAAVTLSLVSDNLIKTALRSWNEKVINDYRFELAEQKQKELELQNMLHAAHLKLLESQIDPHFLFNALNTIAHSAILEGADRAAKITYSLGNLLRVGLGKGSKINLVKDELQYIRDYVFIQSSRFSQGLELKIEADDRVQEMRIPYMTLLVFVENAIVHGFKDQDRQGIITVRGYSKENSVVLEVEDNGCGISAQALKSIELLKQDHSLILNGKELGIYNVYRRLEHYYENHFSFDIERREAGGTVARIVLYDIKPGSMG